jgi:hypothetical protein
MKKQTCKKAVKFYFAISSASGLRTSGVFACKKPVTVHQMTEMVAFEAQEKACKEGRPLDPFNMSIAIRPVWSEDFRRLKT